MVLIAMLLLAQLPWYGPLLPVEDARVVVAAHCQRGEKLAWTAALRKQAHGVEPGERVWLITRDGAVPVRLGEPACLEGECGGDYAALVLPERYSRTAIAVVPLRFLEAADQVRPVAVVERRSGACAERPRITWKAHQCTTFSIGDGGRRLQVQTESKPVLTGWNLMRTHARVLSGGVSGEWQLVGEATSPLQPEAVLIRDGMTAILWRQRVGIGGPSELTLVLSRVEPAGFLTFGLRYTAGGQPCD
jgi:hypothetical protein